MTSEELQAQITAAAERQQAEAELFTSEAVRILFEKNPDILAVQVFGWTPGFNDGDPCYHHQRLVFTREGGDEGDDDGYGEDCDEFLDQLADQFQLLYDTNFELTYRRDQPVTVESYYCGY